jgi:hypothetical protein
MNMAGIGAITAGDELRSSADSVAHINEQQTQVRLKTADLCYNFGAKKGQSYDTIASQRAKE